MVKHEQLERDVAQDAREVPESFQNSLLSRRAFYKGLDRTAFSLEAPFKKPFKADFSSETPFKKSYKTAVSLQGLCKVP